MLRNVCRRYEQYIAVVDETVRRNGAAVALFITMAIWLGNNVCSAQSVALFHFSMKVPA